MVYETKVKSQIQLHTLTYLSLRTDYNLRSQMAQSVMKTVLARYRSILSSKQDWVQVVFKKPGYDLVWNRDYSLTKKLFSVNTCSGRIKVHFETKGMEAYFD